MNLDQVKDILTQQGIVLNSVERTSDDDGYCLRCATREVVTVFDSGRLSFQGRNQARMKMVFERAAKG